jgi:hypothetical protein
MFISLSLEFEHPKVCIVPSLNQVLLKKGGLLDGLAYIVWSLAELKVIARICSLKGTDIPGVVLSTLKRMSS